MYRSGEKSHCAAGSVKVWTPISKSYVITKESHIFWCQSSILASAKYIYEHKNRFFTVGNEKISLFQIWKNALVRKHGSIYAETLANILLTILKPRKIHRHFFHALRKKHFNFCAVQTRNPPTAMNFLNWERFDENEMFLDVSRLLLTASVFHFYVRTASSMKVLAQT